jgi:hypothetical protein
MLIIFASHSEVEISEKKKKKAQLQLHTLLTGDRTGKKMYWYNAHQFHMNRIDDA